MKKTQLIIILSFAFCFTAFQTFANDDKTFRISKNLGLFNSIVRELDLNYVDTLNYDKLTSTAISSMLRGLDPYTVYIEEEQKDDLTFMTTGEYGGIGALISKNDNGIFISDPYEGKPAQKNDIRAGDIILEVDGVDVTNMSITEVTNRLKGTPNTTIKIKIQRPGEKKPIEKNFLRERIQINSVTYSKVYNDSIAYILLTDFTDHAAVEVKNTLNDMIKTQPVQSLVLDLRGNGGGLINEAVKILGYFLPKGTTVVTTKGKDVNAQYTYKTPTEPIFPDVKLVVLTNNSSASASEIIAGAVQDLDRGVIIGERTFGKGLVQSIRPLGYGAHLKITTAKYYIPSGRCIQAIDYSNKNEDGSIRALPDSLTNEFTTNNGRKVRDGGGIAPDIVIEDNRKMNIAYYIYAENHYFDFATQYVLQHSNIASPDKFVLSDEDFNAFKNYLIEKDFNYTSQTERYFNDLRELAEYEGIDAFAEEEFEALKLKLKPDISQNIEKNKDEIANLLSLEIIKRYYYQKGEVEFSLRSDEVIDRAISVLKDNDEYNRILTEI